MKQTPESNLYNRAVAPRGSGAINGPQWQTVQPVPVQPAKPSSFPWRLFIFMGGLIWISSLVWNHSKTPQERSEPPQVQSTRAVVESPPQVRVARALPIRVERALPIRVERALPIRVERALPVGKVPRAEAVPTGEKIDADWLAEQANVGKWVALTVPGEGSIWAHYKGQIPSSGDLPASGQPMDWYHTPDGNSWIWMRSAATGQMAWMDP